MQPIEKYNLIVVHESGRTRNVIVYARSLEQARLIGEKECVDERHERVYSVFPAYMIQRD